MTALIESMRADLASAFATTRDAVGQLVRRGETLERISERTCDLEDAAFVLKRRAAASRISRTQLSLAELAFGCAVERPGLACALALTGCALIFWATH